MEPQVSVETTQLDHYDTNVAKDNRQINGHGCVPTKLYLQREAKCQIWPEECALQTSSKVLST